MMASRKRILFYCAFFLFLLLSINFSTHCSQDNSYVFHIVSTPTAERAQDSSIQFGMNRLNSNHAELWQRAYEIEDYIRQKQVQENVAWQQRCDYLRQQGYDPVWCLPAVRFVETRCTAINFTNADLKRLTIPPSRLPDKFRDAFEIQDSWLRRAYIHCFDDDDFREDFAQKIRHKIQDIFCNNPSEIIRTYMRAEMRNWGRYNHEAFCKMLQSFLVYELKVALKLQEEGYEIIEFSRKTRGILDPRKTIEHDIITSKGIIECKDLYWEKQSFDRQVHELGETPIGRLLKQSAEGIPYAKSQKIPYYVAWIPV